MWVTFSVLFVRWCKETQKLGGYLGELSRSGSGQPVSPVARFEHCLENIFTRISAFWASVLACVPSYSRSGISSVGIEIFDKHLTFFHHVWLPIVSCLTKVGHKAVHCTFVSLFEIHCYKSSRTEYVLTSHPGVEWNVRVWKAESFSDLGDAT